MWWSTIRRSIAGRSGFCLCWKRSSANHKHPVGGSWRMDETYIKVKGAWKYLYRAVDKQGKTVDFLLTANRDASQPGASSTKRCVHNDVPDTVTMDKSGANKAALDQLNARTRHPDQDPASQIPQQHRGAGSPCRQTRSPGRCSASSRFALRKQSSPASNSCT